MFKKYCIFFLSALSSDQSRFAIRKTVMVLIVLLFLSLMVGCYSTRTYRGDGKIMAVKDRVIWFLPPCTLYTLQLGPIDLTKKNKKVFAMQGLPHKEMGLTLEVSLLDQKARIWETIEHKPNVLIRAELVDETTKALISDDSHLNQVTWGSNGIRAYIYLRIGFTPRIRTKYMLTIEVLEPDAKADILSAEAIIQNSCSL